MNNDHTSHSDETSQGKALGFLGIGLLVFMAAFALLLLMGTMYSFS